MTVTEKKELIKRLCEIRRTGEFIDGEDVKAAL